MGWFKDTFGSSAGGNALALASLATPLSPIGAVALGVNAVKANRARKDGSIKEGFKGVTELWTGDKDQLSQIEQGIADAQNSPYNTAKVSEQGQAFYDNSFKDYLKYQKLAESGLSQAEKDLATGQFAKAQNFASQNALNQGGGNLAPYINTVLNSNANDFSVNLAAKDAEAKRQNAQLALSYLNNLGQGAEQFNRASNLNFEKQTMAEQALGQAKQDFFYNRDRNRMGLINTGASLLGQGINAGAQLGVAAINNAPSASDVASIAKLISSDIRLKENIQLERQEKGLNIYSFNYKTDKDKRYEGVMAQEVIETHPEAVIIDEDGYYKVFYSMLGIEMKQIN
jgi:hypothetical protein